MPENYLAGTKGLFCNYWIMSKENFNAYMEWSSPLFRYALEFPDAFIKETPRSLGVLAERLFILWYGIKKKRTMQVNRLESTGALNRLYRDHLKSNSGDSGQNEIVLPEWYVTLDEVCRRHRIEAQRDRSHRCSLRRGTGHISTAGRQKALWVEADPQHMAKLQANLAAFPGQIALQACLTDKDGELTTFYRTNNHGESSSVLPLGTHQTLWPAIHVAGEMRLETTTFRTLAERQGLNLSEFDMLVIDVQGAELLVLKGFDKLLNHFRAIFLEVNRGQVYKGCPSVQELDGYLKGFGFKRRETMINSRDQGDALYLREGTYEAPPKDLVKRAEDTIWRLIDLRSFEVAGWQRGALRRGAFAENEAGRCGFAAEDVASACGRPRRGAGIRRPSGANRLLAARRQ